MPALPDRAGRPLPDTADVVVIGGGYTGINAARELARRGVAVTLLEAHTLGWGASTRNGGIVHAGYKWGPRELIERYGEETGARALPRDARRLRDRQAADRRGVDRLRLPRGRPPRARLRGIARARARARAREPGLGRRRGVDASRASASARRSAPTPTTGRSSCRAAGSPPGPLLRRPGRRGRSGRRRPPRRRPGANDPAPGGRPVRRRDRARRDPGPRRRSSPRTATPTASPRRCAGGSSRSAATSSPPSRCPRTWSPSISPKGRAFFDTKNFLYYWHISADRRMVFGGRASMLPTSIDRTAAILHRGLLEVHPQLAGRRIDYAWGGNVGFTFDRMPHVGRTNDGVAYAMGCCGTGRRADDPPRHGGRGVAGRRRGAGARAA